MEPQDHKAVLLDTSRELVFGFLLFEGFEVLDLYGPVELFDSLRRAGKVLVSNPGSKLDCEQIWKPCHLQAKFVTVAATRGPGVSAQGPATTAQHTLEDCPRLDVLLVPGGPGTRREVKDRPLLPWLRKTYPQLQLLLSVCTGAALLGAAGLLDGRRATTNKLSFKWASSTAPHAHWEPVARYVQDRNIITAAGVSAGMDMALFVLQQYWGLEVAEQAAKYAEYRWDPTASAEDPFGHLVGSSE